ncbi:LPXTG cell wall anchor domain-containing protein [Streptomyces sp. TBY4]|uniref:LPXTG cell wall anchor domain-containing protein n=1 Tax=Streptomyces sp. TBY4 TaxID=2962030 RepID=UPI0020B63B40|nr:LPXTG cell wall anchor domain-containing protein [Streptomyces sp. TBY4]MCP3759549.1 LPXTG cell wall anchor domain-containing protein [Streptomyces sp. TBY4]
MSARTAALRTASASVVVAAVAGTVLMPMTASAEEGNPRALKTTMSAPVPSGPLTRGGATESFELTVTNPTDKVSSYHPWMLLDTPGSTMTLQQSDVVFKVEAVDAPATESEIGQQDGGWQGLFRPADKSKDGFEIPAGGKLTWKVTMGLGKSYPTNTGDFTLRAASYAGEIAEGGESSLTFKTSPAVNPWKLETSFTNVGDCEGSKAPDCREMELHYRLNGTNTFDYGLATSVELNFPNAVTPYRARVKVDGAWKDLGEVSNFRLPVIPKGFGNASGEHVVRLQIAIGSTSPQKAAKVGVHASVGYAEGNGRPFAGTEVTVGLAPKTTTPPTTPAPTSPAPTTPAPTTPAPTGSTTTAPVTTAPVATTSPATGNTPAPTGSLARTGSDSNTALYSGLAAVLIGLGGVVAWFARRRRTVRG